MCLAFLMTVQPSIMFRISTQRWPTCQLQTLCTVLLRYSLHLYSLSRNSSHQTFYNASVKMFWSKKVKCGGMSDHSPNTFYCCHIYVLKYICVLNGNKQFINEVLLLGILCLWTNDASSCSNLDIGRIIFEVKNTLVYFNKKWPLFWSGSK